MPPLTFVPPTAVASILQVTLRPTQPAAPGALPSDAEALDAYSRVVTHVAEHSRRRSPTCASRAAAAAPAS